MPHRPKLVRSAVAAGAALLGAALLARGHRPGPPPAPTPSACPAGVADVADCWTGQDANGAYYAIAVPARLERRPRRARPRRPGPRRRLRPGPQHRGPRPLVGDGARGLRLGRARPTAAAATAPGWRSPTPRAPGGVRRQTFGEPGAHLRPRPVVGRRRRGQAGRGAPDDVRRRAAHQRRAGRRRRAATTTGSTCASSTSTTAATTRVRPSRSTRCGWGCARTRR